MRRVLLYIGVLLAIAAGAGAMWLWDNRANLQQMAMPSPRVAPITPNPIATNAPTLPSPPVPGQPMAQPVALQQAITQPAPIATNATSLAASLPAGMRAVSLSADANIASHMTIGDHVDVLFTHSSSDKPTMTEVLLPNVAVLAVNAAGKNDAAPGITVEASTLQVQKLFLAEKSGTISLALRSAADKTDNDTPKPTGLETVLPTRDAETHHMVAAAQHTKPVMVIRGTDNQSSKE